MLREGPRDSTSTPDKDNYNFPFKTELSADCLAHMLWQGCLSLLIKRICLDLLEKYVSNSYMRNALAGKKLYRAVNTVCSASEPTRNSHLLMITTTMQAGSPDRARRKRTLELLVGVSITSNKLASREHPPKAQRQPPVTPRF